MIWLKVLNFPAEIKSGCGLWDEKILRPGLSLDYFTIFRKGCSIKSGCSLWDEKILRSELSLDYFTVFRKGCSIRKPG